MVYSCLYVLLQAGEASQVETVSEENKGLIWGLLKQLRPGMDLSKVVLPTFILEPRSFLDKLSDYYYHADFLSQSVTHSLYMLCMIAYKWAHFMFFDKDWDLLSVCFYFHNFVFFTTFSSFLAQSCTRGECIWSDQAGVEMVLVWLLQEAQGKMYSY